MHTSKPDFLRVQQPSEKLAVIRGECFRFQVQRFPRTFRPRRARKAMQNIFISYRRDDASDVAGRIADVLKREFGRMSCLRTSIQFRWGRISDA